MWLGSLGPRCPRVLWRNSSDRFEILRTRPFSAGVHADCVNRAKRARGCGSTEELGGAAILATQPIGKGPLRDWPSKCRPTPVLSYRRVHGRLVFRRGHTLPLGGYPWIGGRLQRNQSLLRAIHSRWRNSNLPCTILDRSHNQHNSSAVRRNSIHCPSVFA